MQESLGFSPADLFHSVRGPLKILKDAIIETKVSTNVLEFVNQMQERLRNACSLVRVISQRHRAVREAA